MNAGRELDALVAERVVGWASIAWRGHRGRGSGRVQLLKGCPPGAQRPVIAVPHYSTDIADAWTVLDHFSGVPVSLGRPKVGVEWSATVGDFVRWADSAPLAICRAALAAVGAEVPA